MMRKKLQKNNVSEESRLLTSKIAEMCWPMMEPFIDMNLVRGGEVVTVLKHEDEHSVFMSDGSFTGRYSDASSVGQSGFAVLGIKDPSVTPTGTYYYDDFAVSDSGMPGVGGSYIQFATANGTYTGYTASSGTKFGAVSTIPYSTGTYISTASGAAYTATFQSYAGTGTPSTVKTFAVAADPGGGGGNFSTRLRFGSTDDDTTPNALNTTVTVFQRLYQVNLNGSRWTTVDFNALESGVVSAGAARAYAIYLLADNSTISAHAYQPSGRLQFSGVPTLRTSGVYAPLGRLSVSGLVAVTVATTILPTGQLSVSGVASPTTGQVVIPVGKLTLSGTLPATPGGTATFMYSPSGRLNLIPDRQLVGWYTFYDQQGSRLTDSSLYQDHGTLVGMSDSNWLSTINGYGLTFNGSGQYVSFSTLNVDTSTSGAAAVASFWMYWQGSSNQSVFTIGNSLCVTSTGIGWSNSGGSTDLYGVATTGLANTWVHVIAVFRNSTTNYRLYLNGVQQTLSALVGSTTGSSLSATVYLGGNGTIFNTFTGVFAGLKIYNRDVTAADVAELAANGFAVKLDESAVVRTGQLHYPLGPITLSGVSGMPGTVRYVYLGSGLLTFQDPSLLLWLRLEEGTGTSTVYDSSIYGRIGSMNNMENGDWVAGVPTIRYLYGSNYALQFDGVNEYLQVASAGLTNPEYTIVLWVNPGALPEVEQYSSGSEGQGDPGQSGSEGQGDPGQGMAGPLLADPPTLIDWQPV
jgi:hypothetical protein